MRMLVSGLLDGAGERQLLRRVVAAPAVVRGGRNGADGQEQERGEPLHLDAPRPGWRALTKTAMFPYGGLFSSMSWWHSGMSSKTWVWLRHGATLPSPTSVWTAAAWTS